MLGTNPFPRRCTAPGDTQLNAAPEARSSPRWPSAPPHSQYLPCEAPWLWLEALQFLKAPPEPLHKWARWKKSSKHEPTPNPALGGFSFHAPTAVLDGKSCYHQRSNPELPAAPAPPDEAPRRFPNPSDAGSNIFKALALLIVSPLCFLI